jgi:N6-L-threonylcarbamoyladenine synthase
MIVLGIETSCDETSAALVRAGREVLSQVIFSQVALHRPYGGVVPEIASRNHVEKIMPVISEARAQAGLDWDRIDRIAVTSGPGLASALMIGVAAAKSLSLRLQRPLVAINHIEAHLYSAFLDPAAPDPAAACPLLVLIVSGGHTCLVRMSKPGVYRLIGQTIDDAAGEAFDKGANLLGLGYPGGPAIDRAAQNGNTQAIRFPRGLTRRPHHHDPTHDLLCLSFSGLKTSLLYHLKDHPLVPGDSRLADLAASYQEAIVDSLVRRTDDALRDEPYLAVVGGVSLNRRLREQMTALAARRRVRLLMAPPTFCADNAAMIAGLAGSPAFAKQPERLPMDLDVDPSLELNFNLSSATLT